MSVGPRVLHANHGPLHDGHAVQRRYRNSVDLTATTEIGSSMSKLLAVSWNFHTLRYVLAETNKRGSVKLLNAGEKTVTEAVDDAEAESESSDIVLQVHDLVSELKASRARLILCVGRGSVDSVTFTIPPASNAELPTLVQNMAQRQLTGLGEDTTIDFVSFPPLDDGSRQVSAMVMAPAQEQLIHRMAEASASASAVVVTHPLRTFVPSQTERNGSAALVVSRGQQSAHILVVQHQQPVLSRTLRLAPGTTPEAEARFISAEIQRTILTLGEGPERGVEITTAVLVGSPEDTAALAGSLEGRIDASLTQTSADELIGGWTGKGVQAGDGPLIAAVREAAERATPPVDFLNPKRPPTSTGRRNRLLAVTGVLMLLAFGGWYYVHSLFAEWNQKIADLQPQLEAMRENVKKTVSMRRQAMGLARWERSRMSWLDEIRDITIRMPSSPELSVQQFAATPAGSGYTVTFQGTSRSPEAHRRMEVGIQDRYHTTRTPSFSESRQGKQVVWNFRTTLQIRQRPREDYMAHRDLEIHPGATLAGPSDNLKSTTSQTGPAATPADRGKLHTAGMKAELEPPKS